MMYKKTEEGKKNIKKFKKEQKEKFMKVREHIL